MSVGPLYIQEAKDKYFPTTNDTNPSNGEVLPEVKTEGKIFYHIDGERYFANVYSRLASLGSSDHFFYFTGWNSKLFKYRNNDDELLCVAGDENFHFGNLLVKKAKAGVKIRGLLWLNKIANNMGINQNASQAYIIRNKDSSLQSSILLNRRAHPAGAQHIKIVVAYDGITLFGFVGGIDLMPNRFSNSVHSGAPNTNFWHDVAVEIRGSPAELVYQSFKQLWEHTCKEETKDTLKVKIDKDIKSIKDPPPNLSKTITNLPTSLRHLEKGLETVEFLRTMPQFNKMKDDVLVKMQKNGDFNFTVYSLADKVLWPWCKRYDFAPNGDFSFKVGLKAAIQGAEDYIYLEDQFFWSTEVMDWLNLALKDSSKPNLKIILLTSGRIDPDDEPMKLFYEAMTKDAANEHLYKGLTSSQLNRVKYYVRKNVTVHSKLTIIDDNWTCIGSANIARRSLYTDIEFSVGILTELTSGGSVSEGYPENPPFYEYKRFAKKLRIDLWAHHHSISNTTDVEDLKRALTLWGFPGANPLTPSANVEQKVFDSGSSSPNAPDPDLIRRFVDADSRNEN